MILSNPTEFPASSKIDRLLQDLQPSDKIIRMAAQNSLTMPEVEKLLKSIGSEVPTAGMTMALRLTIPGFDWAKIKLNEWISKNFNALTKERQVLS